MHSLVFDRPVEVAAKSKLAIDLVCLIYSLLNKEKINLNIVACL